MKKTKQKHDIICVGRHYAQAKTNNINKTWSLLQTTEGKPSYDLNPPFLKFPISLIFILYI
jgi:hypothetical protein